MRYCINNASSILFVLLLSLGITACSNNTGSTSVATKGATAKKAVVKNSTVKKPVAKTKKGKNQHRHPANKCINAVSHAHPNKKGHLHYYHFCKLSEKRSNAHTHPATGLTGSSRHVHPNGWRKHSHHQRK